MVIRQKDYLRSKFVTGAVPTQQDFTDLIDTLISQINERTPDMEGNAYTDFRIITPLGPDIPPSTYPIGAIYTPTDSSMSLMIQEI